MSSRLSIWMSSRLARLVARRPLIVLALSVLVAGVAVWGTVERLHFQADRNDLLSKDLDWNRRIIEWWTRFPNMADMIVAVDVASAGEGEAGRARAESVVRELAGRLGEDPHVVNVDWGAPEGSFSGKTIRLLDGAAFEAALGEVRESGAVLESPTAAAALERAAARLAAGDGAGGDDLAGRIESLGGFVDGIGAAARGEAGALGVGADGWRFLESPNGRFLFLRLTPRDEAGVINGEGTAIASIRRSIEAVEAGAPGVEIGLTGIAVVEADETDVATRDSALSSALAALLISCLLIFAFHGWRKPLLAMVALLIGIAWTFGFLTLAVGHLQILSVVFVVILLGIGIDFSIHLATTIEEFRHTHPDGRESFETVLAESIRVTGPGVLTGAATTAAAFLSTTFTDFKGVAELGIIASGGIVLCMVSTFLVFPSLLSLLHHSHRHFVRLSERRLHVFESHWPTPFARRPWATVAVAGVLIAVAGAAALRVEFSEDLLALQPRGVDSVEWQERIAREGEISIWYGVSVVESLEEARALRDRYAALANVSHIGGIGLLFPEDEEAKLEAIRGVADELDLEGLGGGAGGEASAPALLDQLRGMRSLLDAAVRGGAPAELGAALGRLGESIDGAIAAIEADPEGAAGRVGSAYRAFREEVVARVRGALDPSPIGIGDFPMEFIASYVDRSDPARPRYAMEIHPRLPEGGGITSPLDPRFLDGFMASTMAIDPELTGVMPQIYYSNEVIRASFVRSALIAIGVVALIVFLVFGTLVDAALCMTPVFAGFVLTFGVMDVFGLTVNPANIIVLPLLFGIGIDSGVHILHRYRLNPGERPLGLTHGTGKGVTLTSLTTMVGFASMMVARHRGIQGLGMLLTIGIGLTLVTCWTLLPALLELRARRRGGAPATAHPSGRRAA